MPDGKGGYQTFEFVPDGLHWYRWTKRYGMPRQGTWADQPKLFLLEIDSARRGEEQRLTERERKKDEDVMAKFLALLGRR